MRRQHPKLLSTALLVVPDITGGANNADQRNNLKLQEMRPCIMARQFKEQLDDPQFAAMSFEDWFSFLVDAEWTTRKSNHLKRVL